MAAAESIHTAATAALLLENEPAPASYLAGLRQRVDGVLRSFGQWLPRSTEEQRHSAETTASKWLALRPKCPIVRAFPQPAASTV